MALYIRLNGVDYTNFKQANVTRSMENACGSFTFSTTANADNYFPILVGDEVQIIADEAKVLTGYVEQITMACDASSHTISVSGRSKLADLVDSNVGATKEFDEGSSFKTICSTVLADLGLDVSVIDNVGTGTFEDKASADVGENAFAFLETLARKKSVLLSDDEEGNLVLSQSGTVKFDLTIKNVVGGNDNNVLMSELVKDHTQRFNKYTCKSQLNPLSLNFFNSDNEDVVNQESIEQIDSDIRSSRVYEFEAEESMTEDEATARAKWERAVRIARSTNYTARIQGHTNDAGEAYTPNTIINVLDNFAQLDEELLVKTVVFDYSDVGGSTTTLTMTYKDAFNPEPDTTQEEGSSLLGWLFD